MGANIEIKQDAEAAEEKPAPVSEKQLDVQPSKSVRESKASMDMKEKSVHQSHASNFVKGNQAPEEPVENTEKEVAKSNANIETQPNAEQKPVEESQPNQNEEIKEASTKNLPQESEPVKEEPKSEIVDAQDQQPAPETNQE